MEFIHKQFPNFPLIPPWNILEDILGHHKSIKVAISEIYTIINTKQFPSMAPLRILWVEGLNLVLEENVWDSMLNTFIIS